jgi:hypothetical protein
MTGTDQQIIRRVLGKLEEAGLLLESDARLPSVATIVTGRPVSGSWWGDPKGHLIFRVNEALADHSDVLVARLISGKLTLVHRRLWPEFLAIATARERWQTRGLERFAMSVFDLIGRRGSVQARVLVSEGKTESRRTRDAIRVLEKRLLIHARSVHTETGAHDKVIQSWDCWRQTAGLDRVVSDAVSARSELEQAAAALGGVPAVRRLPWATGSAQSRAASSRPTE